MKNIYSFSYFLDYVVNVEYQLLPIRPTCALPVFAHKSTLQQTFPNKLSSTFVAFVRGNFSDQYCAFLETLNVFFLYNRYLNPPNFWVVCSLESRELMALCLKRLKNLSKVKLIDANFVWTEPHSKRLKVNFRILSSGTSERMMNKSILRPDPFSKNG